MKIEDATLMHKINQVIEGEKVIKGIKQYKDAKHFYKQIDPSLDDEKVMYEVYSVENGIDYVGNLNWGLTVMHPIKVCEEFNMTRGHFHHDLKCNEFYYCTSGSGLLLLMDEDNHTWAQQMVPGSLHNIPGNVAHRLVNTGDTLMKVVACWSSKAGHDYQRIEQNPFGYRIFADGDELRFEEFTSDKN